MIFNTFMLTYAIICVVFIILPVCNIILWNQVSKHSCPIARSGCVE